MDKRTPRADGSELNFKPAHQGLGFHPFSDGLPYAPSSPSTRRAPAVPASGATVAGPARIAPQITIRGRPLSHFQQPEIRPEPVISAPEPAPAVPVAETFGIGYLLLRMTAFGIDVLAHASFSVLVLMTVMAFMGHEPLVLFEAGIIEFALLFTVCLSWALVIAQEVVLGSTPGKRIVGLRLEGSAAAIFMRSFFFIPSVLFMGVGLIWALFNRSKRCWHDMAADIQPVRVRKQA